DLPGPEPARPHHRARHPRTGHRRARKTHRQFPRRRGGQRRAAQPKIGGRSTPLASLRTALRALVKNKLRSVLAMLGIVIAVAAVVATVAIGQGAEAKVAAQMASLGSNLLMILPGSQNQHGAASGAGAMQTLTREDAL